MSNVQQTLAPSTSFKSKPLESYKVLPSPVYDNELTLVTYAKGVSKLLSYFKIDNFLEEDDEEVTIMIRPQGVPHILGTFYFNKDNNTFDYLQSESGQIKIEKHFDKIEDLRAYITKYESLLA